MKKNTHPEYYPKAKIVCACGNSFVAGSTVPEIKTDLCSACHPFYTGKQKLVDTAKRVEKYQAKVNAKKEASKTRRGKKLKRAAKAKRTKAKNEQKSQKEKK